MELKWRVEYYDDNLNIRAFDKTFDLKDISTIELPKSTKGLDAIKKIVRLNSSE